MDGRIIATRYASTCQHCQSITEFESIKKMHEHIDVCRGCMKMVCLRCFGKPCRPFEKEAERRERDQRLQARIDASAWGCY